MAVSRRGGRMCVLRSWARCLEFLLPEIWRIVNSEEPIFVREPVAAFGTIAVD
jgi:hypothetical protein